MRLLRRAVGSNQHQDRYADTVMSEWARIQERRAKMPDHPILMAASPHKGPGLENMGLGEFNESWYQGFRTRVYRTAISMGVYNSTVECGAGWFKGEMEPCALITLHGMDEGSAKSMAYNIARFYDQEAVRIVVPNNHSDGRVAELSIPHSDIEDVGAALRQARIMGATMTQERNGRDRLILAEPDGRIQGIRALERRYGRAKVYAADIKRVGAQLVRDGLVD